MAFRSILDPKFQYRNAASTDITQTFKRIRTELLCPSVHVATNLDKASKPQVSVGGKPFVVTLSPEGLKFGPREQATF